MKLIKITISLFLTFTFLLSSPLPTHAVTQCSSDSDCQLHFNNRVGCSMTDIGQAAVYKCDPSSDVNYIDGNIINLGIKATPTDLDIKDALNIKKKGPECTTTEGEVGVSTALGCISTDVESGGFINTLLQLAIGLGGMIALLLILGGVFIITTSAGIPEKLNQGKELITSAISGLLFIILSIVLLNLIGIKILAIPGF